MNNVALERSIYKNERVVAGEVIWVSLDEKNIHAFIPQLGETLIFHVSRIYNMIPMIEQLEDGQDLELLIGNENAVIGAKLVFPQKPRWLH